MSAAPPDQRDEFITARIQEQALAEQLALKDRALDVAAEQPPLRMPGWPLDRGFMPTTGSSARQAGRSEWLRLKSRNLPFSRAKSLGSVTWRPHAEALE